MEPISSPGRLGTATFQPSRPVLCVSKAAEPVSDLGPGPRAGCDWCHHPRGSKPSGSEPGLEVLQREVGHPERAVRDDNDQRSTQASSSSVHVAPETPSLSSFLFRYGEALFMNSKLISGVTEFLNTERELNEVRETSGVVFSVISRLKMTSDRKWHLGLKRCEAAILKKKNIFPRQRSIPPDFSFTWKPSNPKAIKCQTGTKSDLKTSRRSLKLLVV